MENVYSQIDRINVISSEDLVNWTDHGTVYAAGANGAAPWGKNSWAPAAACKEIDGVMKFFLYFANGGNGARGGQSDRPVYRQAGETLDFKADAGMQRCDMAV